MKYTELVEKFTTQKKLMSSEVSGSQIFMLLHDKLIKNVRYRGELYEINFIPMDEPMDTTIRIDDELYPTYRDADAVFRTIIDLYKKHELIYIDLNDEFYEIIPEILESE